MELLQHYLNSLHIYCRLRNIGVDRENAILLAKSWEKLVHPILYRG